MAPNSSCWLRSLFGLVSPIGDGIEATRALSTAGVCCKGAFVCFPIQTGLRFWRARLVRRARTDHGICTINFVSNGNFFVLAMDHDFVGKLFSSSNGGSNHFPSAKAQNSGWRGYFFADIVGSE